MNNYYELRPCKPKVAKLKKLLEENMYSGKECEEDEQHQGHKVRDLRVKLFVIIFFTNTLTIKSAEMLMNAIAFSKQNVHACSDILFFIAVLF